MTALPARPGLPPAADPLDGLIARVLAELLPRIGADGRNGMLLAVFTGATVGLEEAAAQARALILAGYRLRLVFSAMAEHLYGPWLRAQLAGFPEWQEVAPDRWYDELTAAAAVTVPMLSVNTLSRLALLIAGDQPGNLILHGLFAGKPVVLSEDGVVSGEGRRALGFDAGNPALKAAIVDRLGRVRDFGATVVPGCRLAAALGRHLSVSPAGPPAAAPAPQPRGLVRTSAGRLIDRTAVVAVGPGGRLKIARGAVVTPLARDAAGELGVAIERMAE